MGMFIVDETMLIAADSYGGPARLAIKGVEIRVVGWLNPLYVLFYIPEEDRISAIATPTVITNNPRMRKPQHTLEENDPIEISGRIFVMEPPNRSKDLKFRRVPTHPAMEEWL